MAIVQNPITGRSSGSFSNAIFSTWKGKNVIRSKALEVKPSNKLSQIINRNKLKICAIGAKATRSVILKTFKNEAVGKTEYNVFVQKNLAIAEANVTTGALIGFSAVPTVSDGRLSTTPKRIISAFWGAGSLLTEIDLAVTAEEKASLEFTFVLQELGTNNTEVFDAISDGDIEISASVATSQVGKSLTIVAYNPSNGQSKQFNTVVVTG